MRMQFTKVRKQCRNQYVLDLTKTDRQTKIIDDLLIFITYEIYQI